MIVTKTLIDKLPTPLSLIKKEIRKFESPKEVKIIMTQT
jgi:hypothetical protein